MKDRKGLEYLSKKTYNPKSSKAQYQGTAIQELLKWGSARAQDEDYYRDLAVHGEVMGGFEQTVAFTHASITTSVEADTEADIVTIYVTANQKRDKFVGVAFGDELGETVKKAKERVANPPRMNIIVPVPVVAPNEPLWKDEIKVFSAGENPLTLAAATYEYIGHFYTNVTFDVAMKSDKNYTVFKKENETVTYSILQLQCTGYRFEKTYEDGATNFKYSKLTKVNIYRRNTIKIIVINDSKKESTFLGYVDKNNLSYAEESLKLFNSLGYNAKTTANSYELTHKTLNNKGAISIPKAKVDGHYLTNAAVGEIRDKIKTQIPFKFSWDDKNKHAIFDLLTTDVSGNDREIIIPTTVYGRLNGSDKILKPTKTWGAPGKGSYPQGVQKDVNGRYIVAVGPKIIDPNYPDNGKIWNEDFDDFSKKIDVYLKHEKTGETKIIKCVAKDFKSHSYNKYIDGHPYNTGDTASFDVENGLLQTGIAYPNSVNAKQALSCSPAHMNGTVIEFCGHKVDINTDEYTLTKLMIMEE